MRETFGKVESRSAFRYPCFCLHECGGGKLLLEFDSPGERNLYKASMLELLGRYPGNKIENMQIPGRKTEETEINGKFCLTLMAEHGFGGETNGFLYRGVLVEPRILRLTDIARFHRLMDQCRVKGRELPPFDEIREHVKNKKRELLECLRNEGILSVRQMAETGKKEE